ncbi:Ig-like domain-containing protein [Flavobacterium amniphilum]|uniref:Ig-like domain-containing protein n=1 Tax=Flavobacterium amniphilum TaxID=1834035 RepID=UPI00202A7999|nr:Ig-like domain-containing protein [Flavobacterium amniphilum]MCL9806017.1 Ig-like domain-containing protein [Flavobacterium amniphilum]
MRKLKFLAYISVSLSILASCAKRGSITGGDKDITPPKIVSSYPKNLSTDFNEKTIKITFDEYVKIKDLQKNLITSPLMKTPITVLPQGSASKQITIKINDTLQPNTTYSFNFGESIVDNNEGNPLKQFKYTFSTGKELDSLSIQGIIKDAYEKEAEKYVNVMLYEVDENYTDSIIFKQTPRYITNTLDSTVTFKMENIKAGKYRLVALKEKTVNYKFDPNTDKIGFYNQTITIPDPSIFELELFKETPKFKAKKAVQASANRGLIAYDGEAKNIKTTGLYKDQDFKIRTTRMADKDTLQIWFASLKTDSIQLKVNKDDYTKDFVLKMRNLKQDTLSLTSKTRGTIGFNDSFKINTTTPLDKFDNSKMKLIKKDSSAVNFTTKYDEFNQTLEILFDKEPNEKYSFSLEADAIQDYLGQSNKQLTFNFSTKSKADYGNLTLDFKNPKSFPILIELTDNKGKVLVTKFIESNPLVEFLSIEPQKYSLRIIYDSNKNGQYDPGNYLENRQAEEVYHFPTEIDVRSNWDVNQKIELGN